MKYKLRADGKYLVTRLINGRVFRNIVPAENLPAIIESERNRMPLTPQEQAKRSIPFGQFGYIG